MGSEMQDPSRRVSWRSLAVVTALLWCGSLFLSDFPALALDPGALCCFFAVLFISLLLSASSCANLFGQVDCFLPVDLDRLSLLLPGSWKELLSQLVLLFQKHGAPLGSVAALPICSAQSPKGKL